MIILLYNSRLLALSVSSMNPIDEVVNEDPEVKAIWIVVLIAIILACVLVGKYLPSTMSSIKDKRAKSEIEKKQKERDAELERLHRIKEKNKRK